MNSGEFSFNLSYDFSGHVLFQMGGTFMAYWVGHL